MSKLVVLGTLVVVAALAMANSALAQDDGGATDDGAETATDTPAAPDDTAENGATPVVVACPPDRTTTVSGAPCTPPATAPVPSFATLGPVGGNVKNWITAGATAK